MHTHSSGKKQGARRKEQASFVVLLLLASFSLLLSPCAALAAATVPAVDLNAQPGTNNQGAFQIVHCDGPDLSQLKSSITINVNGQSEPTKPESNPPGYTPCDFEYLMVEAQFLINAMLVVGVLAAILGFAYAGVLFIQGTPGSITTARKIFPKIAGGFILMLTAWFIVYQILSWLTGNASAFLGSGS